jgi:hypothetical protein
MTPAMIWTIVRDAAVLAALGFVIWRLVDYGEDRVKSQDLKAVQAQIAQNSKQVASWQAQAEAANAKESQDLASVDAHIAANHAPIIVRVPTRAGPVPGAPACPAGADPNGGGADPGSGVDIRPALAAFETKYEKALADCRQVVDSWPAAAR